MLNCNRMRKLIGVIFLLLFSLFLSAQVYTTKGTQFWTSFMTGSSSRGSYSLIFSADSACDVKIESLKNNWEKNIHLEANSVDTIQIPYSFACADRYNKSFQKGLRITSSDTISVYARYYLTASSDIACVLPEETLSDEYIVQSYPSKMMEAQFLILATQDSTIIDIAPSCDVSAGYSQKRHIALRLNSGEVYQVHGVGDDISGSRIKARDNKKIAVINGSSLGFVPDDHESGDHIFEQALPVRAWGYRFVVVNTINRPANRVRVTASVDSTRVMKNNVWAATLKAYETYEFEILEEEKTYFIETSAPCIVYQYMVGWSYMSRRDDPKSVIGDPSMCQVLPLDFKLRKSVFATYNEGTTRYHRIAIVVNTFDVSTVRLDGNDISAYFMPVQGNPNYSYTRLNILPGKHELHSTNGFIAQVYGYGVYESYLYYLGFDAFIPD